MWRSIDATLQESEKLRRKLKDCSENIQKAQNYLFSGKTQNQSTLKRLYQEFSNLCASTKQNFNDLNAHLDRVAPTVTNRAEFESRLTRKKYCNDESQKYTHEVFGLQAQFEEFTADADRERLRDVFPEMDDEKLDEIVEAPETMKDSVMTVEQKKIIDEVTARCDLVMQLTRNMEELEELFNQANTLIHSQRELVDRIDRNTDYSLTEVVTASESLTDAVVEKKEYETRCITCRLLICTFTVIFLLVLILMPLMALQIVF